MYCGTSWFNIVSSHIINKHYQFRVFHYVFCKVNSNSQVKSKLWFGSPDKWIHNLLMIWLLAFHYKWSESCQRLLEKVWEIQKYTFGGWLFTKLIKIQSGDSSIGWWLTRRSLLDKWNEIIIQFWVHGHPSNMNFQIPHTSFWYPWHQ